MKPSVEGIIVGGCLVFFTYLLLGWFPFSGNSNMTEGQLRASCIRSGGQVHVDDCVDGSSNWNCNTCGEVCYWGDWPYKGPTMTIIRNPCDNIGSMNYYEAVMAGRR